MQVCYRVRPKTRTVFSIRQKMPVSAFHHCGDSQVVLSAFTVIPTACVHHLAPTLLPMNIATWKSGIPHPHPPTPSRVAQELAERWHSADGLCSRVNLLSFQNSLLQEIL